MTQTIVGGRDDIRHELDYRGDVQGLRAVAIVLVVGAHANVAALAGGFIGVDVFFVLSGYLITRLLLREIESTGGIRFGGFYARRLRRLLPALVAVLGCTIAVGYVLLPSNEQEVQAPAGAAAAFWISNLYFAFRRVDYFGADAGSNVFLHTWSLGVEEQFYLLWPALLLLVARSSNAPALLRRLNLALILVFSGSLLLCLSATYLSPRFAFYMMPTRAWQFALGALICLSARTAAVSVTNRKFVHEYAVHAVGWAGLGLIGAAAFWLNERVQYPGFWAVLPSLGAAMILWAGSRSTGGVGTVLSWRPMQAVGNWSYAWYLWHWPVLLFGAVAVDMDRGANRAALITLSLLLAAITYRCVENPIRLARIGEHRPAAIGAASIVTMVAAGLLAGAWFETAKSATLKSGVIAQYQQARFETPEIYLMGCDDWYRGDEVRVCAFGPEGAAHTAVVIGDSVGLQWFPALKKVFDRPDWRLLVFTKSACPMVAEAFFYPRIGREYTECSTWRASALAQVAVLAPEVAILGSSSAYDFTEEQWVEGTTGVLATLSSSVDRIFILRPTPVLPFDGPACLTAEHLAARAASEVCSATATSSREEEVYRWLAQAANRFPGVTMVDMNDAVCPGGWCYAERDGVVVYRDAQHLAVRYASSLAGELGRRLE